jgi:hypothetical protein
MYIMNVNYYCSLSFILYIACTTTKPVNYNFIYVLHFCRSQLFYLIIYNNIQLDSGITMIMIDYLILVSLKNCLYLTKILCWKITHSITTVVHSIYIWPVLRNHLCLEAIVWHSFDQTMNIDLLDSGITMIMIDYFSYIFLHKIKYSR